MTPEEMERMLQKHDEALLRIELGLASVAVQQAKTERSLGFLASQQADFYAALGRLTERLDGFEKATQDAQARQDARISNLTDLVGRVASAQVQLIGVVDRLSDRVDGLAARIDQLAEVTQERLNTLAEALNALAGAQKVTEERLNSFIALVARYISGRNGGEAPR